MILTNNANKQPPRNRTNSRAHWWCNQTRGIRRGNTGWMTDSEVTLNTRPIDQVIETSAYDIWLLFNTEYTHRVLYIVNLSSISAWTKASFVKGRSRMFIYVTRWTLIILLNELKWLHHSQLQGGRPESIHWLLLLWPNKSPHTRLIRRTEAFVWTISFTTVFKQQRWKSICNSLLSLMDWGNNNTAH